MAINWRNGGDSAALDYRPGGPGNNWKTFDTDGAIDAPSGGGRASEALWGRGERSGLQPKGRVYTGNPEDWSFNISYRLTGENILKRLKCAFDVRARQYCGNAKDNMTGISKPGMIGFMETTITSFSYNNGLAMMDGQGTDVIKQGAGVATIGQDYTPLAHDDISLTTSDVAYNRVIGITAEVCAGACGLATTEEDGFVAVTDKDTSPLYSGNSAPWLYYTLDGWQTRTGVRIGIMTASDALDVVLAGDRIVVFSDTKAPAYARLADIYNGVVDPLLWSTSSGLTSLSSTNFPKAAVAVDSSTILAVGNGGRIFLSTDGGISFTIIYDTGAVTSQNLNCIDAQAGGNAYAGGNSGVFIRLIKTPGSATYTASLIVVRDSSSNLMSSNVNSVRTPSQRGNTVVLGTAGGEIWRSQTVNDTRPVFTNMSFDKKGVGTITDMCYAGYRGDVLFVIQTYTDSTSRVLRDLSGDALGTDTEPIGDFTNPSNFKMNSIAAVNPNFFITAGEVHETYAFLGKGRSNAN